MQAKIKTIRLLVSITLLALIACSFWHWANIQHPNGDFREMRLDTKTTRTQVTPFLLKQLLPEQANCIKNIRCHFTKQPGAICPATPGFALPDSQIKTYRV
jgi:hypothetical protein